jgi:hypothetical protein
MGNGCAKGFDRNVVPAGRQVYQSPLEWGLCRLGPYINSLRFDLRGGESLVPVRLCECFQR